MATAGTMRAAAPHTLRPVYDAESPQKTSKPSMPIKFNPEKHISFNAMPKRLTMQDLGLPTDQGISPIAVSEPFPLFTAEAVQAMRDELLSDDVWENCRSSSKFAPCQLRGMAPRYAKFVYEAWTHPQTTALVSKVAGIDLVPNMDYEISHINLMVKTSDQIAAEKASLLAADSSVNYGCDQTLATDDTSSPLFAPVVGWHRDSYPFVCVLMLSDASSMTGGETAMRNGKGEVVKVEGPQMGHAVVLQGRYIDHVALRTLGGSERITAVTSYRPRDPMVTDASILETVRAVSDLNELYNQWADYRLELLEERVKEMRKRMGRSRKTKEAFDAQGMKEFIADQVKYLEVTAHEIVEPAEQVCYRV